MERLDFDHDVFILESDRTRYVPLEGAYNVRHVGGYLTWDGRVTRPNVLFRADSLHRLPFESQQVLLARRVHTIVDLRDPKEQVEYPNTLIGSNGVHYCSQPLYDSWDEFAAGEPQPIDLVRFNILLLERCPDTLAAVFAVLAVPNAFPALVHCAAGKDRTGLVVALLLDLAGVPAETIAADYELSNRYLEPILPEFRAYGETIGFTAEEYDKIMSSPAAVMCETLAFLHGRFGNARSYLQQIGLTAVQLDAIVSQLVV
ncbi:MAG: tyrosine-protein phosphatase [Ardenticatenaceae bacterium]|nr:tyrosine-protein phosphatase [Anaerolineales bacterium]MCB8920368.1 tyrosine-protein phosphatase [Ardenticatenaceae bacterium]MCB8989323.1 tyrosine-protein phosphatase [Ardenticatenaceae bacterium]